MFRANNFDKLLDKATSNLRLEPDWPTILQICDLIRQNDCSPKYAVAAVKKKLYSQNPHQAMFALLTLESIVKNCAGSGVHDEVASKTFCENLRDLVKTTQHENLRNKILELIQAWAFAFRNSPKYRAVQDTVTILKAEGYKFPTLKESDAMFSADTAPEWADGEVCHRCRVPFSLMVRRHHCRACGQVFCQQCSSKTSTLPKFGIEKEVRVCDACFDKVSRPPSSSTSKPKTSTLGTEVNPTPNQPHEKTKEELQEEEELQLALALSQSEAEQKEKERRSRSLVAPDISLHPTVSPTASSVSASPEHSNAASSELSRYLDRNYWEQRLARDAAPAPTAPSSHATHDGSESDFPKITTTKAQEDDAEDKEIDEFVESLKSQVEIFVNRMKSNSSRGRSIANDTSVQTLFMNITAMHSRLLRYIQQQDDKRVYLESLQDKVTQVRDSRAALDTLRAEHSARLAAAAEAADRQRQMQMAAKLQAMRKKKHEYLQYQRQLALQRVQEQEREMQMRQEQQKHQYMISANSYYMPGVSMHHYQPGYPNQPMYASAQFHPQMMPQTTDSAMPLPGQPQMSQANIPMGTSQMGGLSQAVPQLTNTYAMTTSGMTLSQAPPAVPSPMNQPNRPLINPQMPMQQQMMMQQMHQMRMPMQAGVHQLMNQNVANGFTGPNAQQNPQSLQQMPKQNLPNQPQQPNMPPMSVGQQNMGQPINPANSMMGMQMQNMRMPMMQGNPPSNNPQVSGYPMNMQGQQNSQQPGVQMPNISQPSQMPMTSQGMAMPGQQMVPGHNQGAVNSHIPNQNILAQGQQVNQGAPQIQHPQQAQFTHGQPMAMQGQDQQMMLQNQQMLPQGQNIPQNPHNMNQTQQMPNQMQQGMHGQMQNQQMLPNNIQQIPQMQGQMPGPMQQMQGQQIPSQGQPTQQHQMATGGQQMPPQGQQMPPQGQQMPPQGQPMPSQVQQMPPQGQQMPSQGQQMPPQGQQMPPQGQQMPQNFQGQPMKMQQPNFANGSQAPPQGNPNQQPQAPSKSEHSSNTAELISFD